jgi:hypothetical protein
VPKRCLRVDPRERDFMILRFVDQWQYHEITVA